MFTAALFAPARRWKPPKCPLMGEWMSKMWSACTVEYFSALKKKFLTTWRNFEDVMLRKGSQTHKKNKYCLILPGVMEFIETEI